MLQSEFKKLMGRDITDNEYLEADAIYMQVNNLDKFQFCEDWKRHHDSVIISELSKDLNTVRRFAGEQTKKLDKLAVFLIEEAHKYGSSEARKQAIQLIGLKAYLKYLIEHDMKLWDIDTQDMIQILSK